MVTGVIRSTIVLGKAALAAIHVSQRWIAPSSKCEHRLPQHDAVVLDIVTGQRRKSGSACRYPPSIGFDQYSYRAARLIGMRKIMNDEWMIAVECPGGGVAAIAVLGDGQANDPNCRIIDRVQRRLRGLAGENHLADRTNYCRCLISILPLDQRIKRVLRRERVADSDIRGEQSDADDSPFGGVGAMFHQIVRIACHVCAMEAAKAEMDDPCH